VSTEATSSIHGITVGAEVLAHAGSLLNRDITVVGGALAHGSDVQCHGQQREGLGMDWQKCREGLLQELSSGTVGG